jgi:hypothetical protein
MAKDNPAKRPAIVVKQTPPGMLSFDVDSVGILTLNVSDLTDDLRERGMYHGFEQKVRDAAAIAYKQNDGSVRRPTNREKYDAMAEVIERLHSGSWNAEGREGAPTLLFEGLCRMFEGKKDASEVKAWLEGKSDEQKRQLAKNPRIAEFIAKVRAERNPDAVEATEEMLAEWENEA